MSPLLYTIVCAISSLLLIALADYAYKTLTAKWGKTTSLSRKQEEREHTDIAQHLVTKSEQSVPPPPKTSEETADNEDPDDLEEFAKALLKDSKR